MKKFEFNKKSYEIDAQGFLLDPEKWDSDFAEGMAREIGMKSPLTDRHWEVIHFIRDRFKGTGTCPVVFETSRALKLDPKALQALFPTGYFRGACLLSGISYKYGWVYYFGEPYPVPQKTAEEQKQKIPLENKVYRVDLFGSLVDPSEWDEDFAARRAFEMNMKGGLTERHWEIIGFLRESYAKNKKIPTIYECCEANQIDFEEFGSLFPAGYHRGAVKIAGLPTLGREAEGSF